MTETKRYCLNDDYFVYRIFTLSYSLSFSYNEVYNYFLACYNYYELAPFCYCPFLSFPLPPIGFFTFYKFLKYFLIY